MWNECATWVFGNFDRLPPHRRNILWYLFTDQEHRSALEAWESEAQSMIALFRASTEQYIGAAWLTALIQELQEVSEEFCEWWPRHDVQTTHSTTKVLTHALVGQLALLPTTFFIPDAADLRMVVYTPMPEGGNDETLARLITLKREQQRSKNEP